MGRNLEPKHRKCRAYGMKLCDSAKCPITKRNYAPGQHGQKKMRGKVSDYGKQLVEKQKAKIVYGMLERQFRTTFDRARKLPGSAGVNLLALLERRLDNVVFRAGLAPTKRAARQLVNHGHFDVNGVKTDIPSYTVKVGDVIIARPNKTKNAYWKNFSEKQRTDDAVPGWIAVDYKNFSITVVSLPKADEVPQNIQTHLIVEFYSR